MTLPPETWEEERCALVLARRAAALLDRDSTALVEGQPLPRGWHVMLFAPLVAQSALGTDGYTPPPDLGFRRPRLMLGGRRTWFEGEIPIGAPLRRRRTPLSELRKDGRSGPLVVITRRHEIFVADAARPAVIEEEDLIYRETPDGPPPPLPPGRPRPAPHAELRVPDEILLQRYCMLTFNAHRIHYDLPYARQVEHYPALVVNGGLAALLLLDLQRRLGGAPPASLAARNLAPLYCGRRMTLKAAPEAAGWRLWAEDDEGRAAVEMEIR